MTVLRISNGRQDEPLSSTVHFNVAFVKSEMEIDQRKEKVTKNEKTEQTKSQTDNQPPIQEPQQTEQILEFKHKEGGWGWVVLLAVTLSYGVTLSLATNYNLIYPSFINFYNSSEEHNVFYSAWIGSTSLGTTYFFCAPVSVLVDLFGPIRVGVIGSVLSFVGVLASALILQSKYLMRVHFLTYGFLFGVGQSLVLGSLFSILPHYFNKKLGLANGLMNSGGCVIIVLNTLLTAHLLNNFDLSITFYAMAVICLTCVLSSLAFKTQIPVPATKTVRERIKTSLGLDVIRKPKFIVWCLSILFGMYGNIIPIMTMAHYTQLKFPEFDPEILNIIYGCASGLSSIVFGLMIDRLKASVSYNYMLAYLAYAIGTFAIYYTTNIYVYCFIICIFSVFDGLYLCSLIPMACETAESSLYANQALGYASTVSAISMVTAPAVSGALFEYYSNYDMAYFISSACSFAGFLVIFLFYENSIVPSMCTALLDKYKLHKKKILSQQQPLTVLVGTSHATVVC